MVVLKLVWLRVILLLFSCFLIVGVVIVWIGIVLGVVGDLFMSICLDCGVCGEFGELGGGWFGVEIELVVEFVNEYVFDVC